MKVYTKIKDIANSLYTVDKFLIAILILLFLQSAHCLFSENCAAAPSTIDVIVRTSQAAIFGYFLSSGFSKKYTPPQNSVSFNSAGLNENNAEDAVKNKIGFETGEKPSELLYGNAELKNRDINFSCNRYQIVIIGTICIISLVFLMLLRDFCTVSAATDATVSQLRDFVSAGVGFLLGCGKGENRQ